MTHGATQGSFEKYGQIKNKEPQILSLAFYLRKL